MWTLPGAPRAVSMAILAVFLLQGRAMADDYIINQNQTGIALPGVALPNGYDEVRAADGTVCRSAVSGSGAYIDSGLIGGGLNSNNRNTISAYGRVVIPLGTKPDRLNCDHLYQLELERLRFEVQMLKRGLDPRLNQPSTSDEEWATEGWSAEGKTVGLPK